ncbi:hypothetical protein DOTSEDRAFT_160547 [Dothistroma septosporum NZE10]|uniref:Protein YAE1 n=1 Tax=Dothistroma septosporum (strain NZE10 / CBS 128990) TaxID=675120 RepID=M2XHD7_DOTSN|nr:hypothetical protein DOTSEDRAFT_160547 [Dothistroma septosporum NZE10]
MNTPVNNNDAIYHDTSHESEHIDPLDDVFGSAPSSPSLAARENRHAPNTEHSDIPRLRSIHVTSGYREGIAASKEQHIQAGFDEGFGLGGEIGIKVGVCLGVLEGIAKAIAKCEDGDEVKIRWETAKEEMKMERVLGEEYFGPDGIWKYEVSGQDGQGGEIVTFADIARHHPVLKKWREVVDGLAKDYGLVLETA